jgi:hypothetical protein
MKTTELIKDINKSRTLREQLTMEIGEIYTEHVLSKNDSLLIAANEKVAVLKKVIDHIKSQETEIARNNII